MTDTEKPALQPVMFNSKLRRDIFMTLVINRRVGSGYKRSESIDVSRTESTFESGIEELDVATLEKLWIRATNLAAFIDLKESAGL